MEKKTRLEKFKEECDKANALQYCEHSDGAFITLVVSFILGFLIVVYINKGVDYSLLSAFGVCGLIFMCLGFGFFSNRYVIWRRIHAARKYHDEKERLIRCGQQHNES